MEVNEILQNYGLTRDTTTAYIDAIVRNNQTETAEELDVSRDTINRYKKAFARMTEEERTLLIATLTQNIFLERAIEE